MPRLRPGPFFWISADGGVTLNGAGSLAPYLEYRFTKM